MKEIPTIAETLEEIEASFAGTKFPGRDRILHPMTRGDEDEVGPFMQATDWRAVPDRVLYERVGALCYFSPEAFQFFIPAFMMWALRNCQSPHSFAVDATIYALDPGDCAGQKSTLRKFQISKYAMFTSAQKQATANFLRIMAHNPNIVDANAAKSALQHYWDSGS
jgi:hypothetical protein